MGCDDDSPVVGGPRPGEDEPEVAAAEGEHQLVGGVESLARPDANIRQHVTWERSECQYQSRISSLQINSHVFQYISPCSQEKSDKNTITTKNKDSYFSKI